MFMIGKCICTFLVRKGTI